MPLSPILSLPEVDSHPGTEQKVAEDVKFYTHASYTDMFIPTCPIQRVAQPLPTEQDTLNIHHASATCLSATHHPSHTPLPQARKDAIFFLVSNPQVRDRELPSEPIHLHLTLRKDLSRPLLSICRRFPKKGRGRGPGGRWPCAFWWPLARRIKSPERRARRRKTLSSMVPV